LLQHVFHFFVDRLLEEFTAAFVRLYSRKPDSVIPLTDYAGRSRST